MAECFRYRSSNGSIIRGLSGAGNAAQGQANNDANMANNILQEIGKSPDISAPLILQKYAQAGVLTPQMQSMITAQLPAAITTSPQYQQAQNQALQQMQQRANTGFTQSDRAQSNQAQLGAQNQTKARLASIQQGMQQQGLSDSGSALAQKLAASQGEANQMSTNADQQAEMAQNAQQQALGNLGQFSSQLQGNQFNQAFQQQQANQAMQRFNVQNQLGVQSQNTNAQNQAQAANLANAQNASNQNVSANNQAQQQNKNNAMTQYNSDKNTSEVQAGGYGALAGYNSGVGQNQAQSAVNMGAGIGGVAGSLAGLAAYTGGHIANDHRLDFKQGGHVPGHAPVTGDSPANDIVKAVLSPGEIVLPRTLSESKFGKHILKIIEAHNNLKHHINGTDQ